MNNKKNMFDLTLKCVTLEFKSSEEKNQRFCLDGMIDAVGGA